MNSKVNEAGKLSVIDLLSTKFYPVDGERRIIVNQPLARERDVAWEWKDRPFIGYKGSHLKAHKIYGTFAIVDPADPVLRSDIAEKADDRKLLKKQAPKWFIGVLKERNDKLEYRHTVLLQVCGAPEDALRNFAEAFYDEAGEPGDDGFYHKGGAIFVRPLSVTPVDADEAAVLEKVLSVYRDNAALNWTPPMTPDANLQQTQFQDAWKQKVPQELVTWLEGKGYSFAEAEEPEVRGEWNWLLDGKSSEGCSSFEACVEDLVISKGLLDEFLFAHPTLVSTAVKEPVFSRYSGTTQLDETSIDDIPLAEQSAYWESLGHAESEEYTDEEAHQLYSDWWLVQQDYLLATRKLPTTTIECSIVTENNGTETGSIEIEGEVTARPVIAGMIDLAKRRTAFVNFTFDGVSQQAAWTSNLETLLALHERCRQREVPETALPSDAAKAITTLKVAGKVAVRHSSSLGFGPGFYAHHRRADGSEGMFIAFSATEEGAWQSAAIRLAEYKPGVLQMTSREFGSTWTANVLCKDGSLGMLERRSRLEIRELRGQYEVFALDRRYLRGEDPQDVHQRQEGRPFATLADAAGYVGQYIGDYAQAAAEDRAAAVEAQREQEKDEQEQESRGPSLGM